MKIRSRRLNLFEAACRTGLDLGPPIVTSVGGIDGRRGGRWHRGEHEFIALSPGHQFVALLRSRPQHLFGQGAGEMSADGALQWSSSKLGLIAVFQEKLHGVIGEFEGDTTALQQILLEVAQVHLGDAIEIGPL